MHMTGDSKICVIFAIPMIKPMANWMSEHIDETTGLPKPSYDLWEEVFPDDDVHDINCMRPGHKLRRNLPMRGRQTKCCEVAPCSYGYSEVLLASIYLTANAMRFTKVLSLERTGLNTTIQLMQVVCFGAFMFGLFGRFPELTAAVNTFVERF